MPSFFSVHKYKAIALLILLVYLSPYIFFSSKAKFLIHDNLDSNVVWFRNLVESGKMFAGNYEKIERSMGGVDRGCYPSELNVIPWIYFFFKPLTAYSINSIFIHLFAFFSFYLFSRKFIFKQENEFPYFFSFYSIFFQPGSSV